MKKVFAIVAFALLCLGVYAEADVFNMDSGLTSLEMVTVGNAGNVADKRYDSVGFGSVSYDYQIGKYEITAAQYCDFLNHKAKSDSHGLYNTAMTSTDGCNIQRTGSTDYYSYSVTLDWANRPVNYVSYWNACRFVNWLSNGQGDGDTENGAYTIPDNYNGNDGRTIQRNAGAKWYLPSEDEWYKAAYYKGGSTNAGYWDYATKSNTAPGNQVINPDPGNEVNYYINGCTIGTPYLRTNVGEFENSSSAYGTSDQSGNVWEWNEAVVYQNANTAYRGLRGGSYINTSSYIQASYQNDYYPSVGTNNIGFRVVLVPEPSSIIALASGLVSLLCLRRRRV